MKKPFTTKDIDKLKKALHKAGAKPIKNGTYYVPVNTNALIKYLKPEVMRNIILFAIRSGMNLNTGEFNDTKIYK